MTSAIQFLHDKMEQHGMNWLRACLFAGLICGMGYYYAKTWETSIEANQKDITEVEKELKNGVKPKIERIDRELQTIERISKIISRIDEQTQKNGERIYQLRKEVSKNQKK